MNENTYYKAGVDITKGNQLIDNIKPLIQKTHTKEVLNPIGGFASLFSLDTQKYKDPVLVSSTDGVGTKLMIAQATKRHDNIGFDLVAMCANDILCQGATPLFFLDYFATGKLEVKVAEEVILGIASACTEASMSLVGGETAEMPGMYEKNKYDLAGFCVGVVERSKILPKKTIEKGDALIGLKSSGLHSNGFSLVRKILQGLKIDFADRSPWEGKSWGEVLLTPTFIYVKPVLSVIDRTKGIAHITGGGIIENLPRILPPSLDFSLDFTDWPEIFLWLKQEGRLETEEMLRVFNCGIGMVLITNKEQADEVITQLNKFDKTKAELIGYVTQ